MVVVLLVMVIMKVSTGSSYRGRDASSTVPVNCRRLQAEVIFWTTIVKSDHLSHDPLVDLRERCIEKKVKKN